MSLHVNYKSELLAILIVLSTANAQTKSALKPNGDVFYYGFFFPETTSTSLTRLSQDYFERFLSVVPEFNEFMKNMTSKYNISDPRQVFRKPLDPNTGKFDPYYHVTCKFCGRTGNACDEYARLVERYISRMYKIQIVGFVITEKTFGFRVQLTEDQKIVFDNDLNNITLIETDSFGVDGMPKAAQETYPGIELRDRNVTFNPSNITAHITIGCAPDVSAVTTGYDLLGAIEIETHQIKCLGKNFHFIEGGLLNINYCRNETISIFYSDKLILADAQFLPYLNSHASFLVLENHLFAISCLAFCLLFTSNSQKVIY